MRTLTINLYLFCELSETAKENAVKIAREFNDEHDYFISDSGIVESHIFEKENFTMDDRLFSL